MRHALLLATALSAVAALPERAHAEAPFDFATNPGQLPKTVVPSAYTIDIVTDMAGLTLAGHESITVLAKGAGDSVVLNQAGLKLATATL